MIIAATGHRKLPCKNNIDSEWFKPIRAELYHYLYNNAPQIEYCISGMAQGWDLWFTQECLTLNIPVHCYIPFKGQHYRWGDYWKNLYREVLKNPLTTVSTLSEKYYKDCFLDRNKKMVENATHIAACWDESVKRCGTAHTVREALKKDKSVLNFWTNEFIRKL